MKLKTNLLMSAAERAMGRYMKAPDGHEGGDTPAPAASEPAPAPTPAEGAEGAEATPTPEATPEPVEHGMEDDFAEFERRANGDEPAPAEDPPAEEGSDGGSDDGEDTGGDDGAADPVDSDGADDGELSDEQKRIAELEEQLAERDRQREQDRADELERLRAENERLKNPDAAKDNPVTDGELKEPDPKDYEYGDADSKYIMDMADYRAEMRFRQREAQAQVEQSFNEMTSNWENQIGSDEVGEKYSDFKEKVIEGADKGDWKLSFEGSLLVKSSPVAADVAYHLASDPAESRRIAGLSVVEQALEIGRIEGRYMGQGTAQPEPARETPAAQPSKAPPPPKKTVRGAGGRFDVDPATGDFSAFEARSRKVLEGQLRS